MQSPVNLFKRALKGKTSPDWAGGQVLDPAELGARLKADTERWRPLVKAIGFTADT
jgi:tripartite-type tricarboxylate transporter receptor subunit TctC